MSYDKLSEVTKQEFAIRLNEVCDDMGLPEKFKGRQVALAEIFYKISGKKITPNAARKWIQGEGLPSTDKILLLSEWASVESEWLISGRGDKKTIKTTQYAQESTLYKILHVAEHMNEYKRNLALELIKTLSEAPNLDLEEMKHEAEKLAAFDANIKKITKDTINKKNT